ncbi:MAG: hypothetical protein QM726_21485 [Chitinophagaceae bacterium]
MAIFIVCWIVFAFLVALLGATRKIGFGKSLISAILLTPIIGIIIALLSKSKKDQLSKEDIARKSKEYLDLIDPKNRKV